MKTLFGRIGVAVTAAACAGLLSVAASAQQGEFDGMGYTCLEFTNGQGDNSSGKAKADLARFWLLGYMSGHYQGQEKLEMVDDPEAEQKVMSAMLSKCREFPENSILAVAEFVASERKRDLPKVTSNDFDPKGYMCSDHTAGKAGGASDMLKADLADFWAFAFVQGFVNSSDPEIVIPVENKPAITGAITKNCEKNPEVSYFDLTAAVAPMVKPQ